MGGRRQPRRLQVKDVYAVEDHRRLLVTYEERGRGMATSIRRSLIMAGYRAVGRSGVIDWPADPDRRAAQDPA